VTVYPPLTRAILMEKSNKRRSTFVAFFITTVHYDSDGISLRPRDTVTIYRIIPGSFCYPVAVLDIKIDTAISNAVGTIVIRTEDVPVRRIDGELQRVGGVPPVQVHIEGSDVG